MTPAVFHIGAIRRRVLSAPFLGLTLLAGLGFAPAAALASPSKPGSYSAWVVADVDGDQKPELVSLNGRHDRNPAGGQVDIRFGPFDESAFSGLGRSPLQRLRARDLDGDSDRDLVLESLYSVPVAIWINDGAGNFERANPEDFGFQLSHESPQSAHATHKLLLSELSDNRLRDEVYLAHSGFLTVVCRERSIEYSRETPLSGRPIESRSRAPPRSL